MFKSKKVQWAAAIVVVMFGGVAFAQVNTAQELVRRLSPTAERQVRAASCRATAAAVTDATTAATAASPEASGDGPRAPRVGDVGLAAHPCVRLKGANRSGPRALNQRSRFSNKITLRPGSAFAA